jgi:hypothetical protein
VLPFHNAFLLNTKHGACIQILRHPQKQKKASKSMDFNEEMQFQSNSIKIHTLAHATANALRNKIKMFVI